MPGIVLFVDYDNVDPTFTRGGPVQLSRIIAAAVPSSVTSKYDSIVVRLYGGWRSNNSPTTSAQKLIPEIVQNSPTVINSAGLHSASVRLTVELADRPLGWHSVLNETLVKNRTLRRFRANPQLLTECTDIPTCGMRSFFSLTPNTECSNAACGAQLGHFLVRDEQKMVDTLVVADIAFQVFVQGSRDVVVVSSDADIWPGILLALRGGCDVIQVHPKSGGRTQPHLMQTLGPRLNATYTQLSL